MALKDYYNTNEDGEYSVYGANWEAQSFTASSNYDIKAIKLKLWRFSTPGIITVSIRATDGSGHPTGADLISGTTDGDTLTSSSPGEWREIIFSTTYSLVSGTKYAIVMRAVGPPGIVYWRADGSTPTYANGSREESSDSGSIWTTRTGVDFMFEIHTANLPGKPTIVSPTPTGVTGITLDETPLEWAAGDPAGDTYEVYFRESGDDWGLVGEAQAGVEWTIDFGTLDYNTTYEWRIDATNVYGTTTGDTWSFDTIDFDRIRISYRLLAGGGGVGHGPYDDPPGTQGTDWEWTGENTMLTVKRLIVAANDKIWHEDI